MIKYLPNLLFILGLLAVLWVLIVCSILSNRKLPRQIEDERKVLMKLKRILNNGKP